MHLVNVQTLRSYFDNREKINALITASEKIANTEKREIACFRDGCSTFDSEPEIREVANVDRRDIAEKANALVADARQRTDAYLADVYQLRPQVAAELAPLLQARLSDDDLRSLAQQHRDYTSLRMIAGCDGEFAKALSHHLDSYRDSVQLEIDRALKLARSAVVNTPKPDSLFNSRNCWGNGAPIDAAIEAIDALNTSFDSWLDGAETPSDPLFKAVMANV